MTFALITLPLYPLLGTSLVWGMLPFLMLVVAALWFALRRSYNDAKIQEELRRDGDEITLTHTSARGDVQSWSCNIYWVRVEMHKAGGPVPHYVTLTGNGRTVEIGSFLSEEERKDLFADLTDFLKRP